MSPYDARVALAVGVLIVLILIIILVGRDKKGLNAADTTILYTNTSGGLWRTTSPTSCAINWEFIGGTLPVRYLWVNPTHMYIIDGKNGIYRMSHADNIWKAAGKQVNVAWVVTGGGFAYVGHPMGLNAAGYQSRCCVSRLPLGKWEDADAAWETIASVGATRAGANDRYVFGLGDNALTRVSIADGTMSKFVMPDSDHDANNLSIDGNTMYYTVNGATEFRRRSVASWPPGPAAAAGTKVDHGVAGFFAAGGLMYVTTRDGCTSRTSGSLKDTWKLCVGCDHTRSFCRGAVMKNV